MGGRPSPLTSDENMETDAAELVARLKNERLWCLQQRSALLDIDNPHVTPPDSDNEEAVANFLAALKQNDMRTGPPEIAAPTVPKKQVARSGKKSKGARRREREKLQRSAIFSTTAPLQLTLPTARNDAPHMQARLTKI